MKKSAWLVIISICTTILIAGIAYGGVAGSRHDFSIGGSSKFVADTEEEVCIFCHTPHSASATPLWNRNPSTQSFTMYNKSVSSTFDATDVQSGPTGISMLCMSCHDGVTSINVLVNYGPGGGPIVMDPFTPNPPQLGSVGSYPPSNNPNLGTDLSNDHPVSFTFDAGLIALDANGGPARLQLPSAASGLKLFNGKLECATCHDPHEEGKATGTTPFLRMSNAGSDMCLTCHIK